MLDKHLLYADCPLEFSPEDTTEAGDCRTQGGGNGKGCLRELEGPSVSLRGRKGSTESGGGAGATNGKSAGKALLPLHLSSTSSIHIKYNI